MTQVLHGGCSCGAVSYEVDDDFAYALICHCSQCRRASGAANKPFGAVAPDRLRVTKGADRLTQIGDDPNACDIRCADCGSPLWSVVRDGAFVHVCYGTLTDTPSLAPTAHIFVGSKASWEIIADDLPQFETY